MILQIALDLPLGKLFDYSPGALSHPPGPGSRVLVPFGTAERLGIVMHHATATTLPPEKIRAVNAVLTDLPPLPQQLIDLLELAAAQFLLPIGKLVFAALPPSVRKKLAQESPPPPPRESVPPQLAQRMPRQLGKVQQQTLTHAVRQLGKGFAIQLVSGAPGTGKQAIIMETVAACLALGQTVLVLAPNIHDAGDLTASLRHDLPGCTVLTYHSGLAPADQLATWRAALAGACHVLVGTRSAVFAPLSDLGLVCVINENDPLHRAGKGLQYSARDLAAMRCRLANCPSLMSAATPSVELRHAARAQRLHMTVLPKPAGLQQPCIEIIDIATRRLFGGVSVEMENALRSEIKRQGLSVVLVNQRGHGGILFCLECRHTLACPHCTRKLARDTTGNCVCRQCGYSRLMPATCPACGSDKITTFRPGSARVAETLTTRLPEARIMRADSETDTNALRQHLAAGEVDVVVGTNLLLGLRLKAGTIAITDADATLLGHNYRAAELLLDTITQLSSPTTGARVMVQTRFANHHLFEALRRDSYETFAFAELAERETAGLPPFRRLALLSATGNDAGELAQFVGSARRLAAEHLGRKVSVLEPVGGRPAGSGKHRMQLLVSAPSRNELLNMVRPWVSLLTDRTTPQSISWEVEVDPQSW